MENLYTQENLEKLLQECYNEIELRLSKGFGFELKKDKITIQKGHTTGHKLGQVHYSNIEYKTLCDYWGRPYKRVVDKIGHFEITIYDHKNRDIKGIKETIIHELIHTQKDCQNHKAQFKYWCEVIFANTGYSCWSGQHDDTKSNEFLDNYKYFTYCPCCNKITAWSNRLTQQFKANSGYICRKCKTKIQPITKQEILEKEVVRV